MGKSSQSREHIKAQWFFGLALYLIVDFGRPQSLLPILGAIKPGLLTTAILLFFLINSGKTGKSSIRQVKLVLLFIGLLAIYVPFARNNFWAYQIVRNMVLMVPFLLSIIIVIDSRMRIITLFKILGAILVFIACYGLLHGGRGPGGIITDENDLCLFLVTFLPVIFFLFPQGGGMYAKMLYGAIIFLVLFTIVATFSRGGFVGLMAMGTVYWLFNKKKMLTLLFALLLGSVLFMYSGDQYRQEMSTVTDTKENTANARLLSWQAAWNMFKAHPLGVGGNNFPVYFQDYQPEGLKRNMYGRQAHSLWFTLIPETGILGIVIYFLIIRMNIKDLFFLRKINDESGNVGADNFMSQLSTTLLASFAGFFASASFISVLYYPEFWYLTAIVVSVRNVALKDINLNSESNITTVNLVG